MYRLLISIILLIPAITSRPQPPIQWPSSEMLLALKKLNTLGTVLYLAAHPDDENTRLIAYFSKEKLYRTGYLSITRGDGGQNLIGEEQGIELGLIRTQELLAARRIDGGEQFFTRAYDFGYSKNPEETFTKWDKEKILSDVVWVIRKFRPDVIITRFPTTGEGGHGHHTASAILANEAFAAAGDPTKFPEQLKFVQPWSPKRVFWNTFNFGGRNTTSEDQFKINVGGYNPLIGKSYGEIAAMSRSQHKSQGFGATSGRGESYEYLKLTAGTNVKDDLMEGVDVSWGRVNGGAKIQQKIDRLIANFDHLNPQKSVPGLVELYRDIKNLQPGYWKDKKLEEVKELIRQCSGLFIDATTSVPFAIQSDSLFVNFVVNDRLGSNATLRSVRMEGFDTSMQSGLSKNTNLAFTKRVFVSHVKEPTQPYWLRSPMEEGYFAVYDLEKIGQPGVDPAYIASFVLNIGGEEIEYRSEVKYKHTDPVKGELYQPLAVIPKVELEFLHPNNFSLNGSPAVATLMLKSNGKNGAKYQVSLEHPDSWRLELDTNIFDPTTSSHLTMMPRLYPPTNGVKAMGTLEATANYGTGDWSASTRVIEYDHIPTIVYSKPAKANLVRLDVKTVRKHVGYIVGAGDKVPQALEQMGYEVTLLTEKEMARNDLHRFDAILTGVRAYNTNEWLNGYYEKLMDYVRDGGNLVVQYNTSNMLGPLRARVGPYDFQVSRTRVTDEKATVKMLDPSHPVFNFPNKITQEDFKGWIQERSIYHAVNWDTVHYKPLLSMADAGEEADEGSLIVTKYGKGTFVYTGLVFFRELPAGVPGAYRLLANILELNF